VCLTLGHAISSSEQVAFFLFSGVTLVLTDSPRGFLLYCPLGFQLPSHLRELFSATRRPWNK
jgi:hypothetical protein